MCFRTVFQRNKKWDTFIHGIPFTIDPGDPQALFNFPALLGCIGVSAERVPVDVSGNSVRKASESYKVLPVSPA